MAMAVAKAIASTAIEIATAIDRDRKFMFIDREVSFNTKIEIILTSVARAMATAAIVTIVKSVAMAVANATPIQIVMAIAMEMMAIAKAMAKATAIATAMAMTKRDS